MSELRGTLNVVTDGELLDFERARPRHSGTKENAIIDRFGIRPARFYQLLRRAACSLEGQEHDPVTAGRVRNRVAAA